MDRQTINSYYVCYDIKDSRDLAFNQGPTEKSHLEKSTFFAIPFKQNSFSIKKSISDQVKAIFEQSFLKKDNSKDDGRIIDFKAALMPLITNIDVDAINYTNQEVQNSNSVKQFLNHVKLFLPTENQWQELKALRIHAGSPEISSRGLENLSM